MLLTLLPELFTLLRRSNVGDLSHLSFGTQLLSSQLFLQRFPDPVAKFYAAEVALALNYLHSLDIIYRDLKPENILLNWDGHIKIADFGFAKYCATNAWTLCGTPDYLPPEMVNGKPHNERVDHWALGVLAYEFVCGGPPFEDKRGRSGSSPFYLLWDQT